MALFSVVHVISPVNDSSDCGESKSVRPPCSSALDSDSPFWFGSEDSGHVQRVLDQYCIWTQAMTTQERIAAGCCQADRASSRCPDRFVGRVVRRKKAFCKEDSCVDSNSDLVTIDEIRVYERVFVAVSDHFSPFVVYHGVTEWDADGLQTSMQFICPQRYEQYVARSKHTPSILYCRPEFDLDHFYAHSSEKKHSGTNPRSQLRRNPEMDSAGFDSSAPEPTLEGQCGWQGGASVLSGRRSHQRHTVDSCVLRRHTRHWWLR